MREDFINKAHLYFNKDIIDIVSNKRVGNTIDMFKHIADGIDDDMCNRVFEINKVGLQQKISRTFFNYVLCTYDKRILDLCRMNFMSEPTLEAFELFLKIVFYIGKGRKARSISHIDEARKIHNTAMYSREISDKDTKILDAFKQNDGIVIIQCFDSATEDEAFNREACMIEGFGLDNLCNKIHGHKSGIEEWGDVSTKNYGIMLLYKCFLRYITEGTRAIKLNEILYKKSKSI